MIDDDNNPRLLQTEDQRNLGVRGAVGNWLHQTLASIKQNILSKMTFYNYILPLQTFETSNVSELFSNGAALEIWGDPMWRGHTGREKVSIF